MEHIIRWSLTFLYMSSFIHYPTKYKNDCAKCISDHIEGRQVCLAGPRLENLRHPFDVNSYQSDKEKITNLLKLLSLASLIKGILFGDYIFPNTHKGQPNLCTQIHPNSYLVSKGHNSGVRQKNGKFRIFQHFKPFKYVQFYILSHKMCMFVCFIFFIVAGM